MVRVLDVVPDDTLGLEVFEVSLPLDSFYCLGDKG